MIRGSQAGEDLVRRPPGGDDGGMDADARMYEQVANAVRDARLERLWGRDDPGNDESAPAPTKGTGALVPEA